jgi:hypothetical protein
MAKYVDANKKISYDVKVEKLHINIITKEAARR